LIIPRKQTMSLKRIPVTRITGVKMSITDKYAIFCKGLNLSCDDGVKGLFWCLNIVKV